MHDDNVDRARGREFSHLRSVLPKSTMAAETTPTPLSIRARMREAELTARNLILRAAYMEKRAGRAGVDSAERVNLDARARELRADADVLLAEISALSRHVARRSVA
jgi:hypothetical protein